MTARQADGDKASPAPLTSVQQRYYRRRGALLQLTYALLYLVNWFAVRLLSRFQVTGREHLPEAGPFILTPNHTSPLDPAVLAAALPLHVLRNTYWAGKDTTVLRTALRRWLSRITRVLPIPADITAVEAATVILRDGHNLVWFPEGHRSLDGMLQPLKPGIVLLLQQCDVSVVPVQIGGAARYWSRRNAGRNLRLPVSVRFGRPVDRKTLGLEDASDQSGERVLQNLRDRIQQLNDDSRQSDRDHSVT